MKRLIFLTVTLIFLQQARAQFQSNFAPAMCPWQMQPADASFNQSDEKDRAKNYEKDLKRKVKEEQSKLSKIDKRLEDYQGKIDMRLQAEISAKAIEHIQLQGNPADYHRDCANQTAPSAGSTPSNVPTPQDGTAPANPDGTAQGVQSSSTDRFCQGELAAAWSRNIQASGKVNTGICRESSQLIVRPGSSSSASACADALNGYMSLYEQRQRQEKRLAEARSNLDDFEFGDGDSDIEGRCVGCDRRGNSMSTASGGSQWMNLLGTALQVGIPALQSYMTNKQWQKTYKAAHTYEVDNCSRLGYPSQFCYGQYSLAQRYMGHVQNPYPAQLPGYFGGMPVGGNQMVYGAVPGGIGNGAFGCQAGGFNQTGMPTTLPYQFSGNQYLPGGQYSNMPGVLPPYAGGQGPWGGVNYPQLGNNYTGFTGTPPTTLPIQGGAYNPYLLDSQIQLIDQRLGLGGTPPPILPYLGSQQGISAPYTTLPAPVTPIIGR